LTTEPRWSEVYSTLASEIAFPVTDVAEAVVLVQELIDGIEAAK
jgi:hypothetical protein